MLPRIILCMTCLSVAVFGAFALRNADSTVPAEGTGPANAVNEVTTTVANRSEAKEIVDANIESSFIELVPRNANLLVVCRPHEYLTSELGMLSTDWLFQGDSSFEREVKNIELLMFASTEKSAKNLANYRSQHAFETIVAKLNESQQQKARANRVTPTRINILNKDCTALVRFRNPVQWKYFEDWFHNDEEFQGDFSVEEVNGVEVLGCSADNTCVVCKIEENTFVVGNRKQLLKGLESKQATNTKVAQWLEQNVDGELFAAVSPTKESMLHSFANFFEPSMRHIKEGTFALDLDQGVLSDLSVNFARDTDAEKFRKLANTQVKNITAVLESAVAQQKSSFTTGMEKAIDDQRWQAQYQLAMLKSLRVSGEDSTVRIELPLPAKFAATVRKYLKLQQKMMEQFNRQQKEHAVKVKPVVVAAKDIQPGSMISADDVKTENWPEELIPAGAIRDKKSLVNRKARTRIQRHMPVMKDSL